MKVFQAEGAGNRRMKPTALQTTPFLPGTRGGILLDPEQAERETEALLASLFRAVPAPCLVLAPDSPRFTILEVNPAYMEATSRTRESLIGQGIFEAFPDNPDDPSADGVAHLSASLERVLASRRPDHMARQKYDIPRHSGGFEPRWWDPVNAPVLAPDGFVSAIVHQVVDATPLVLAEHLRRRAEEQLHQLNRTLEARVAQHAAERDKVWLHSLDLLSVIDIATATFDAVNPAWRSSLGWEADQLIGHPYADLLHPEDLEASLEAFEKVRSGKPALHFHNRYRAADGSWRWLSWIAVPEGDKVYSVTRDITDDRTRQAALDAAETARREADALYRAYFQNTPEALFVIGVDADDDFVVEQVNPAHEAALGLKSQDVAGKRIQDILDPATADKVMQSYREVISTRLPLQYRETYHLNGVTQHWDTSLVPVLRPNEPVARLVGSSRNVTRQVLAEDALRQSQKMEAIGQLTGGIAHDFNNLLMPIVGALDLLQRQSIGGVREQRLIAGAAKSAERATVLVQRLLAFARRQPLQSVSVDIGHLISGMIDLLSSTLGPQVRIAVDVPPDLPSAIADPNQLEMALLNLSVNARDAMPEGGDLRIAASTRVVDVTESKLAKGQYVSISVSDTGVGMDEQTLNRAVEPFFSTKGVGKGTGLGLSMVHGLALQLGGAMGIKSQVGQGTTVELTLPVSRSSAVHKRAALSAESPRGHGVVLLVEDEKLVRQATADMLVDLGYSVVEANSADAALQRIEEGVRPDLIVTDHLMPGMSGAQLVDRVRETSPALPALIVSGHAEMEETKLGLPRLVKPFRQADLATAIANLLPAAGAVTRN